MFQPKIIVVSCLLFACCFGILLANDLTNVTNDVANDSQTKHVITAVQEVKQALAPDKRVAIFEIEAKTVDGKLALVGATSISEAKTKLLERVREVAPDVIDQIELLPSKKLGEKMYAVVNVSVANLRYAPAYASELGTQVLLGMPVRVLQYSRWYRVQTPNQYICYVSGSSLVSMTKKEFNDWTQAKKIVFVDHYGFSYEQPNIKSQTVSDLVSGCMLKFNSEEGDFYHVTYPDGRKAYVLKSQALSFEDWEKSISLTAESIIAKAKTLKGIPYFWAGTSSKGVDCSGLSSLVFFLHGVFLPRDASQQVHVGLPVDISSGYEKLQPADLLFFGKCDEQGNIKSVRHVAIYIGNGDFIQSAGCVKISSLLPEKPNFDEGNTKELIRARRILGQIGTPGVEKITDNALYNEIP